MFQQFCLDFLLPMENIKAMGLILKSVGTYIGSEISDAKSARKMYHKALEVVMPTNLSTKWILLTKLVKDEFHGSNLADMNDWIRSKVDIHSTLKTMKLALPQEIVPISILARLPPDFQPYIKDFGTRTDLSLNDIKAVTRAYFMDHGSSPKVPAQAHAVNQVTTARRHPKCSYCGRNRHLAEHCFFNPRRHRRHRVGYP